MTHCPAGSHFVWCGFFCNKSQIKCLMCFQFCTYIEVKKLRCINFNLKESLLATQMVPSCVKPGENIKSNKTTQGLRKC